MGKRFWSVEWQHICSFFSDKLLLNLFVSVKCRHNVQWVSYIYFESGSLFERRVQKLSTGIRPLDTLLPPLTRNALLVLLLYLLSVLMPVIHRMSFDHNKFMTRIAHFFLFLCWKYVISCSVTYKMFLMKFILYISFCI